MNALLVAFGVVFLAEFGDKTQLLTLALAARFGAGPVLAGVTITTAGINVLSVTAGVALAHAVPQRVVTLAAGIAFLAFALWSGRSADDRVDLGHRSAGVRVAARSAALFAVSEMGDKTMLATLALAAHGHAASVWAGSTLGVVASETVAVFAGVRVAKRVSHRVVQASSAVAFAVLGVVLIARAAVT